MAIGSLEQFMLGVLMLGLWLESRHRQSLNKSGAVPNKLIDKIRWWLDLAKASNPCWKISGQNGETDLRLL